MFARFKRRSDYGDLGSAGSAHTGGVCRRLPLRPLLLRPASGTDTQAHRRSTIDHTGRAGVTRPSKFHFIIIIVLLCPDP